MIGESEPRNLNYRKVSVKTGRVWVGLTTQTQISTSNILMVSHNQDKETVGITMRDGIGFSIHEDHVFVEHIHPHSPLYRRTPTLAVYTVSNS